MKRSRRRSRRADRPIIAWSCYDWRRRRDETPLATAALSLSSVIINWLIWWRKVWRVARRSRPTYDRRLHHRNVTYSGRLVRPILYKTVKPLNCQFTSHYTVFRQHVCDGDGDVIRRTGNTTSTSGQTDAVAPSNRVLDRRHYGDWVR